MVFEHGGLKRVGSSKVVGVGGGAGHARAEVPSFPSTLRCPTGF